MAQINYSRREIHVKLVYWGPGLSGKTTNLEVIHKKAPPSCRGDLTSISTEQDRTLFFDYMPLDLGKVAGLTTKIKLYTVPGQSYYGATRRLVLAGVDGVAFIADSQAHALEENQASLEDLGRSLGEQGLDIATIPLVIQWNKRDLPDAMPVDELERKLNRREAPSFEAVALTGEGVFPTLKKLAQVTLERLNREHFRGVQATATPATPSAPARPRIEEAPRRARPRRPSPRKAPPAVVPAAPVVGSVPRAYAPFCTAQLAPVQ